MFVRRYTLQCLLQVFVVTLCLLQAPHGRSAVRTSFIGATPVPAPEIQNENAVDLPTVGTLTERPFFSTRRHPSIAYSDSPTTDVVAELKRRVDEGSVTLPFEGRSGYLRPVMEALHVPAESQSVVFSKTSLQSHYISPSNPRAIFFSDDVSVAFIPDAPLLEIAVLDPHQGVVFYAISQRPAERPQIVRSDSCLSCHEGHDTLDVPGMLVRSVATGTGGETLTDFGDFVSDQRSPFEERWGGWFITGKTGTAHHMGNMMLSPDAGSVRSSALPKPLASLDGKFNIEGYPSHFSDVGAVLVLNHQMKMTNLLTRVGWETRVAMDQMGNSPQDKSNAERLIAADAADLADYMLFVGETPIPGKFESTSGFELQFAAIGPRDSRGRSLRQLDLEKRLMRYPCSYMIYSSAFDGLPNAAKEAVYAKLWAVLSGKDKSRKYSSLTPDIRAAIVGILLETKSGLPAYFKPL
jgi:hypothetical protein